MVVKFEKTIRSYPKKFVSVKKKTYFDNGDNNKRCDFFIQKSPTDKMGML